MQTQEPQSGNVEANEIVLPAPTAWPFALALGVALIFAGMLTNVSISVLGAVLYLASAVGWFREMFPHEHHVQVPAEPEAEAEVVRTRSNAPAGDGPGQARVAAAENLSRVRGRKRWAGRWCGHGSTGYALRSRLLP